MAQNTLDQNNQSNTGAIYIGLGANLPSGNLSPAETLKAAITAIEAAGLHVLKRSEFWISPAWPDPSDPPYVNAVIEVASALTSAEILSTLHAIEAEFGRERSVRNAPRPLDLDLVDCRGEVSQAPGPLLPHPRMGSRAFVLCPLAQIAPDWVHPQTGEGIAALIEALPATDLDVTRPLQNN